MVIPGLAAALQQAAAQGSYQISTGLVRDISRYRWLGRLEMDSRFGTWNVAAANHFTSDAFILFDDNVSIRDENRFSVAAEAPTRPGLTTTVSGGLGWYSLSRVFNASALVGMRYEVSESLSIEPRAGAALDSRPGAAGGGTTAPLRTDAGPALGAALRLRTQPATAWELTAEGIGTFKSMAPRRATDLLLQGTAIHQADEVAFSTSVYVSSARRDSYQAVSFLNRTEPGLTSESVEATRSDTLLISSSLRAPLASWLNLSTGLRLGTNRRTVRTFRAPEEALFFDTDFTRRSLDLELDLNHRNTLLDATIGVKGGLENEERLLANREDLSAAQAAQKTDLLRQADHDRGFLELHTRSIFSPLRFLTLHFDGAANILRHDTPTINPDDRDEQLLTGRLGLRLRMSEHLATEIAFYASRYETVYLRAERSAENNVQRALRFRPGVVWTPDRGTRIRLTSEVRATYTVDDFVLPGRTPRDQSARELRYETEIERNLPANLRLSARGTYSDLRLGRFLDEAFAEIPFDTLQTASGWLQVHSDGRIKASIGVRMFIRSDYNRSTRVSYTPVDDDGAPLRDPNGSPVISTITRAGRERIAQIGPTATISWPLRRKTELVFDGWLVVQRITQTLYGDLPAPQLETIRRAASNGRRTIIPNLSLRAVWHF